MFFKRVAVNGLIILALAALTAACGQKQPVSRVEATKIRLGMLPIIDNLPFWVAQEKGYFQAAGLDVELIPFSSAVERDSAFTARKIDGAIGDLLAVAALNDTGIPLRAVSVGMGAKPGESRFAVLSAPGSPIRTPEQLKNVEIAVSLNSIIEYTTDRLLQHQGLKPGEIKKISVPKMPVRLEGLLNGRVQAATLPDPLATLAVIKGAHIVADTLNDNVAQTVIIVHQELLDKNLPAVKSLMNAYARAVADIQANPGGFNNILAENANVPAEVLASKEHRLPVNFSAPQLPARKDVLDVLAWMKERNLLKKQLKYEDLVDERVLAGD
ncbi:MAG: MetQ/NlpA family ABC transporter substrate-binding protein [Bacillota bacterium]